jgi:hypothetical protein
MISNTYDLERTNAFNMESLPIDLQKAIWVMYHTENVLPQLPSHKELWNKKYPDQKLARVPGMRIYNVSQDQTHDVMMAINVLSYEYCCSVLRTIVRNEYDIGEDRDDDAAVRRGLLDYIRSGGGKVSTQEQIVAYSIIREITYNLLYGEYED